MRPESIKGLAAAVAVGLILSTSLGSKASRGDEPNRLGRLFRMGSGGPSGPVSSPPSSGSSLSTAPAPSYSGQPALSTPPSGPVGGPNSPRVQPRARVSRPATEADPLVTRVSLGRSDTGGQFGMFLQVFADGTVIDGEGVHRVPADAIRPIVEAVSSGDLARLKGHCGGPAGDFIENVHVVTYERSLGRLRANAFSYSGNPQGCDHAVHNLQKVLDDLQTRLGPASPAAASTPSPAPMIPASPPVPLTTIP